VKDRVAVIGAGSWATALAVLLGKKGYNVKMWARSREKAGEINRTRENTAYLPGVILPPAVTVENDMEAVLDDAGAVVFAVPSQSFGGVLMQSKPYLPAGALIVNTAKGLEEKTLRRLSEVFYAEVGFEQAKHYVVLSGPSHAEEVGRDLPTAIVAASENMDAAERVQGIFMGKYFRVYTNPDVIGVEMAGALKNIIALGAGIVDGLGLGDNTKAALITRGLAEISRLGVAMGADSLTFSGLAGVGDLMVTCMSKHSRNRRAGIEIGKGKSMAEAVAAVKMVVEGIKTTRAAYKLAQKKGIEMPITAEMYKVLFENLPAREAVLNLMTRVKTKEFKR